MSISIKRYVDVTSGVGGASIVPRRSLGLRLFTASQVIPFGAVVVTTQLDDVQSLFGKSSMEYRLASNYYGFVSKTINSPKQLSFVRMAANDAAVPMAVYGAAIPSLLGLKIAADEAVEVIFDNGSASASFNGFTFTGSTSSTLASLAADLQQFLRTASADNPVPEIAAAFATCIVTPNQNLGSLVLELAMSGEDGYKEFFLRGPLAEKLRLQQGVATSQRQQEANPGANEALAAVSESTVEDDNFGAFGFVPVGASRSTSLSPSDIAEIAAWNHAQNNKFIYLQGVSTDDAAAISALVAGYSGCGLTLRPALTVDPANPLDVCPELAPGAILGATDFSNPAASQNYMFYQFASYTPTVTSDPVANTMDALRVNYIGRTQTAGQKLSFYQRGMLQGGATAAVDMAVYAGEIWLKDAIVSTCMNGLLALPSISANREGRTTVLGLIQGPVDEALDNGVISVGKALDNVQKAYIKQITGNEAAWRQVEEKGYWLDAEVKATVTNGVTEYYIEYLLIYSKNDQIRKVVGRDIMI